MPKFVIERELPGAGKLTEQQIRDAAPPRSATDIAEILATIVAGVRRVLAREGLDEDVSADAAAAAAPCLAGWTAASVEQLVPDAGVAASAGPSAWVSSLATAQARPYPVLSVVVSAFARASQRCDLQNPARAIAVAIIVLRSV
jgi:hypothetical protein